MKKDDFLTAIQGEAKVAGSNYEKVWKHAVEVDENDPRWKLIYCESYGPYELAQQYARHFGVELRKAPRRKQKTKVEIFTERLKKAWAALEAAVEGEEDICRAAVARAQERLDAEIKREERHQARIARARELNERFVEQ